MQNILDVIKKHKHVLFICSDETKQSILIEKATLDFFNRC